MIEVTNFESPVSIQRFNSSWETYRNGFNISSALQQFKNPSLQWRVMDGWIRI